MGRMNRHTIYRELIACRRVLLLCQFGYYIRKQEGYLPRLLPEGKRELVKTGSRIRSQLSSKAWQVSMTFR